MADNMKEKNPAKEAKKLAKRNAKKTAFATLQKRLIELNDKVALDAFKAIKPGMFGMRASFGDGGPARHKVFTDMFVKVGDTVDEVKLFQTMKAGRKEAAGFIRVGLKKAVEKDRKWITFSPETGVYKLVAIGENAPKDWSGYVPTVTKDIFAEK